MKNLKWTIAIAALVPVGALVANAARQKAEAARGDFKLRYEFRTGSVAPPYYHETSILVRRTPRKTFVGTMLMRPGYPIQDGSGRKGLEWSRSFPIAPASIARLRAEIKKNDLFNRRWIEASDSNRPVGGGAETLEMSDSGRRLSIPNYLPNQDDEAVADELYKRVNALVPAKARAALEAQRAKYQAQTEKQINAAIGANPRN